MEKTHIYTWKLRREIVAELEQQQKADSEAAKKIRNCLLANTKDLLDSLASLLESCGRDHEVTEPERLWFSRIARSFSVDRWVRCRTEHMREERKAESLRSSFERAQNSYNEVSKWGRLTRAFMNENEKRIFDALKSRRDQISADLGSIENEIRRLEENLGQEARMFLDEAMSTESLESLRGTPALAFKPVQGILLKMTDEMKHLAGTHAAVQFKSLANVRAKLDSLAGAYATETRD